MIQYFVGKYKSSWSVQFKWEIPLNNVPQVLTILDNDFK
jgi:hypothetical protein